MRRIAAAVVLVLGVGAAVAVSAAPASAAPAATPVPGTYQALPSAVRFLDTHTGAGGNHKGVLVHGATSRVTLGSHVDPDASAALISLTTVGATANGFLTAFVDGPLTARPPVWSMIYPKGTTTTVTVLVALKAAKFLLYNGASSGSTHVQGDLLGYYYYGGDVPTTSAGAMNVITPTRVAATATLAAGQTRNIQVGPTGRNTTAALTITELGATKPGAIVAYPKDVAPPATSSLYYPAGYGYSGLTFTRVGTDGFVTVTNRGSSTVRLAVDTPGFANRAAPNSAGALQALEPQRVVPTTTVGAGKVATFTVAGKGGVAVDDPGSVVAAVTVTGVTKPGGLVVGAPGRTTTGTRTASFAAGNVVGATTIVPTPDGRIEVRNVTAGSLGVVVDVLGYLPSNTIAAPATTVSRYLDNLTTSASDNAAALTALGCSDAQSGADFVLLDIGTQSYSGPELSIVDPGVAVALTKPTVRLSYADLLTSVQGYLDGFQQADCATSASAKATIAIGTNNSGNFRDTSDSTNPPYAAGDRGTDWYTDVVKPLQLHAGSALTVIGASDIENGTPTGKDADYFDDQYSNAKAWEDAYLKAAGPYGTMVFNGSANGCPTTYGSNASCNDGWTLSQFASLTNRVSSKSTVQVTVLPQIYYSAQALQWANIDRVAGGTLKFQGALTQYAVDSTTFSPEQGWTALYRAISSVVATPDVPRAVDITRSTA